MDFLKILSRSDVELPRQAENDKVKKFRHYMEKQDKMRGKISRVRPVTDDPEVQLHTKI